MNPHIQKCVKCESRVRQPRYKFQGQWFLEDFALANDLINADIQEVEVVTCPACAAQERVGERKEVQDET